MRVFLPTFSAELPETSTLAALSAAVAYTLHSVTSFATEAVYEVFEAENLGESVPLLKERDFKLALSDFAASVTVIAHDEPANKDIMLVTVEAEGRVDFEQTGRHIRDLFKSRIGVTPKITVVPVGTLPRSEKKTQRVIDHREQ